MPRTVLQLAEELERDGRGDRARVPGVVGSLGAGRRGAR